MELTRYVNGKVMRCGYTTGSCAAGASKAAAMMLLGGKPVEKVDLMTPAGELLHLDILDIGDGSLCQDGRPLFPQLKPGEKAVSCAVRKDSGDDPDVTNGMPVYACVSRCGEDELSKAEPGSKVVLEDMAIYSMVKNNTFNGIPLPAIAIRRKSGKVELLRQFGYEDFKKRLGSC